MTFLIDKLFENNNVKNSVFLRHNLLTLKLIKEHFTI